MPNNSRKLQELPRCGTLAAYIRHQKRGEPRDEECKRARREYERMRRRRLGRREIASPGTPLETVGVFLTPEARTALKATAKARSTTMARVVEGLIFQHLSTGMEQ